MTGPIDLRTFRAHGRAVVNPARFTEITGCEMEPDVIGAMIYPQGFFIEVMRELCPYRFHVCVGNETDVFADLHEAEAFLYEGAVAMAGDDLQVEEVAR